MNRPNKKREFKNKKFGFGGQKKRSKYNTAESAADISEFRAKKAHGKGPGNSSKVCLLHIILLNVVTVLCFYLFFSIS